MSYYDLLGRIEDPGQGVCTKHYDALDYLDGKILGTRPGREWAMRHFGFPW